MRAISGHGLQECAIGRENGTLDLLVVLGGIKVKGALLLSRLLDGIRTAIRLLREEYRVCLCNLSILGENRCRCLKMLVLPSD